MRIWKSKQEMVKSVKCCLVTICFLALGFILCRFAMLYHDKLSSKLRIYSYFVAGREVTIKQDGSNARSIDWSAASKLDSDETSAPSSKTHTNKTSNDRSKTKKVQDSVTAAPTVEVLLVTPKVPPTIKAEQPISKPISTGSTTKENKLPTVRATTTSSQYVNPPAGEVVLCSKDGEKLVGALAVDQSIPGKESDIDSVWDEKGWVEKGGAWRPRKCQPVSKVAIIIPYRNRLEQLKIFLRHIHPMLRRQLLDYRIMVVEQAGETPFNRAMLFNIGYKESLKFRDFQCFVFHDVDLIPEDDHNYYGCPKAPRHMSVAIDKYKYRLPYASIFGGAGSFRRADFEKINGFSNRFWGWGGEDDDLYQRITAKNFKLTRPSMNIGRYKMVRVFHKSAKADPERFAKLRNSKQRMGSDGLNSLKYKVQKTDEHPLYTLVTVEVDPTQV